MPVQVESSLPSRLVGGSDVDDEDVRSTMLLLWRRAVSWSALRPDARPDRARQSTAAHQSTAVRTVADSASRSGLRSANS